MRILRHGVVHVKFIFGTAIDDLEWKNTIDFEENGKTTEHDDEQAACRPFWPRKLKLGQVEVGLNIAQNNSSIL